MKIPIRMPIINFPSPRRWISRRNNNSLKEEFISSFFLRLLRLEFQTFERQIDYFILSNVSSGEINNRMKEIKERSAFPPPFEICLCEDGRWMTSVSRAVLFLLLELSIKSCLSFAKKQFRNTDEFVREEIRIEIFISLLFLPFLEYYCFRTFDRKKKIGYFLTISVHTWFD